MTNLLAIVTVCIITNVTHCDNEVRAPHQFQWVIGEPQSGSVVKEATEKTETTEVVEVLTIKIEPEQLRDIGWIGGKLEGKQERVLSRNVRRWRKREEWIEED
jgi:hypothetical protein